VTKETNEVLKKLISEKLDFLRKNSGETNEAAADSLDIDLSEFYRILKGHRLPHLSTLLRINQKYGVSMDWWFSELDGTAQTPVRQKAFELQISSLVKKLDAKTQAAVLAMLKILVQKN
jgi:transcriptional regulator with XRE-family HTH domain